MDHTVLAGRILAFLDRYAGLDANHDPAFDSPEDRFSSPDASMLNAAALLLARGEVPGFRVHSSFGSGGYRPWNDEEGQREHDEIVATVNSLVT